jgi:hypothetical protein
VKGIHKKSVIPSKRPILQIIAIEEEKEVHAHAIHNIFKKITAENFTNLKKEMPIQVQEPTRTPNRHD